MTMTAQAQRTSHKHVVLNGAPVTTAAATLAAFLVEQGFGGRKVASAVNGSFVAEKARAKCELTDGDRIEIVSARQGG